MKSTKIVLIRSLVIIVFVITIGATFYHFSERLSWIDSYYLTVMTVLTVGYGDLTPQAQSSRVFTMIFVVISIPTVLFLLGNIIESFVKNRLLEIEEKMNKVIKDEEKIIKEEKKIIDEEKKELELLRNIKKG